MKRVVRVALLASVAAVIAACGRETPTPPPPPVAPAAAPSTAPAAGPVASAGTAQSSGMVTATVRVKDLAGNPLPDMLPIATTEPNAFDAPVAKGVLTGADGTGRLEIPAGKWLYVRAWDPTQRLFANNYYEIPAEEGNALPQMEVVMVPGARLRARLSGPDGAPLADADVGLMLYHPTAGPWWPSEAHTDATGAVEFPPVPAGRYVLRLKAGTGARLEVPETDLPPGGLTDLGPLSLREAS